MPFSFLRIDQFRSRIQHINTNWSIDPKGPWDWDHLNLFPWLCRCVFHVSSPSWALLWACCDSRRRVSLAAICICTLVSLIGCCLFACAFAYWVCVCFMSGRRRWRRRRRSMNSQLGNSATENPETRVSRQSLANFFPSFSCFRFWSLSRIIRRMVNGSVAEQWRRALLNFIFFSVVFSSNSFILLLASGSLNIHIK